MGDIKWDLFLRWRYNKRNEGRLVIWPRKRPGIFCFLVVFFFFWELEPANDVVYNRIKRQRGRYWNRGRNPNKVQRVKIVTNGFRNQHKGKNVYVVEQKVTLVLINMFIDKKTKENGHKEVRADKINIW